MIKQYQYLPSLNNLKKRNVNLENISQKKLDEMYHVYVKCKKQFVLYNFFIDSNLFFNRHE